MSAPKRTISSAGAAAPAWIAAWSDPHSRKNLRESWVRMRDVCAQLQRDGMQAVEPVCVAFGSDPQELRRRHGRGTWRLVVHDTLLVNVQRMALLLEGGPTGVIPISDDSWKRVVRLDARLLGSLKSANRLDIGCWMRFEDLLSVAEKSTREAESPAGMHRRITFVLDCLRMGVEVDYGWSVNRLTEEHDEAVARMNREQRVVDDVPFCEPWDAEEDGFRFELMCSKSDVVDEGRAQHHCAGIFADECARGRYIILRVTGRERATLGVNAGVGVRGGANGLVLNQLFGARNSKVSDECRAAARKIIESLDEHLGRRGVRDATR